MSRYDSTLIKNGSAHYNEWKEKFIAKANEQFPSCVRERHHGANIHCGSRHTRVRAWAMGSDVYLATYSGSVARGFAGFFIFLGVLSIIGSIGFLRFTGAFFWPVGIVWFIIAGILFSVDNSQGMNDQVFKLAKETWDQVMAPAAKPISPSVAIPVAVTTTPMVPVVTTSGMKEIEVSAAGTTAVPRYCAACGASIQAGARFCASCGSEV
ncbi:MAG TPA: zinc-ribbon domain-containing protein [Candidatus Lokiarchaeia archaeon]|nr:zinc-ribbon domain-containing protein [Candidatus Lokiarchaeia archaeon]